MNQINVFESGVVLSERKIQSAYGTCLTITTYTVIVKYLTSSINSIIMQNDLRSSFVNFFCILFLI